ncbi:hypothetical protein BDD12DRAFT_32772 [Trichophaea hybrida]|nr:hypothetical protein BDD12DRAFT_32772 [Trichophaea hybrida]
MIERELRDMRSEEKATQDRVSKILQDCQENLAELRKDTEHLHGYFEVLYCLVKYITKQPGPNGIASSEELTKEQITDLNADITKLCVHYTIAGEISSTFVNVSRDFIMPGVDRVDSLSKTSARAEKSNISGIIQKIADYSNMAQEKIHDLAAMRRENLRKRLLDTERKFEEVGDKVLTLGSEQGKE